MEIEIKAAGAEMRRIGVRRKTPTLASAALASDLDHCATRPNRVE